MAGAMKRSLLENAKAMESDAAAMGILKQNGLTAREYTVGVVALRMSLMASSSPAGAGSAIVASPENVAFAKANLGTLNPRMEEIDRCGSH